MALVNYMPILTVLGIILGLSVSQSQSVERKLVDDLKLKELTCCIPQHNTSHTIKVNYGISLIDVISFDHDTGIAEFLFWEKMQWTDFRLKWDPSKYNNVKSIRVDPEQLWIPDIKFYSGMSAERVHAKAVVYETGMILWIPPVTLKKRCVVDGDEVDCGFKVGSWTYDGFTIDLDHYNDEEMMDVSDLIVYNGQIEITKNTAKKNVVYYPCCSEPYPHIRYVLAFTSSDVAAVKALPVIMAVIMSIKWII